MCYKAEELMSKCPITDIRIVETSALSDPSADSYIYEGYTYRAMGFNETASVIFSKEVPQLPPTTIKIEA